MAASRASFALALDEELRERVMRRKFPTPQQVDLRYHVDRDARILRLAPDAKA